MGFTSAPGGVANGDVTVYDNTNSGLSSANVSSAIDEVVALLKANTAKILRIGSDTIITLKRVYKDIDKISVNGQIVDIESVVKTTDISSDNLLNSSGGDSGVLPSASTLYYVYLSNKRISTVGLREKIRLSGQVENNNYLGVSGDAANWRFVGLARTNSLSQIGSPLSIASFGVSSEDIFLGNDIVFSGVAQVQDLTVFNTNFLQLEGMKVNLFSSVRAGFDQKQRLIAGINYDNDEKKVTSSTWCGIENRQFNNFVMVEKDVTITKYANVKVTFYYISPGKVLTITQYGEYPYDGGPGSSIGAYYGTYLNIRREIR